MRFLPMRSTLICLVFLAGFGRAADKPLVLDVWPGKPPGEAGSVGEETITGQKGGRSLTNVSKPTLTVYRPAKDKDTGVAVVVAPGGGYRALAWDHEGEDVAAWLNSIGVTGVLLKYRVPRRDDHPKGPLSDAQRALSLVRGKAKEWGIDAKKIGMLGFSAGGHLTALTATNFDRRAYEPVDEADKESCRPDFAVIVYPGGVVRRGSEEMDPAIRVSKETPPAFITQASDDHVGVENSVILYLALKKAGVPAEMHLYAAGGHGYGLRPNKRPASAWTKRCEEWLRSRGVLPAHAAR
ncbi:MAG TPA: alpha/beta hydrolase [Gemmataceae bacterium]